MKRKSKIILISSFLLLIGVGTLGASIAIYFSSKHSDTSSKKDQVDEFNPEKPDGNGNGEVTPEPEKPVPPPITPPEPEKPPVESKPTVDSVTISGNGVATENDELRFTSTVIMSDSNQIPTDLTYQWYLKSGESLTAIEGANRNSLDMSADIGDNGKSVVLKVTYNQNSTLSNSIELQISEYVDIDPEQLLNEQVISIESQNIQLANNVFSSQSDVDAQITIQTIMNKITGLTYDNNRFSCTPENFSVNKDTKIITVSFRITYLDEPSITKTTKDFNLQYVINTSQETILDKVINQINATDFRLDNVKIKGDKFKDLTYKSFSNLFIMSNIEGYDLQQIQKENNITFENCPESTFKVDRLLNTVEFQVVVKDNKTQTTKTSELKKIQFEPTADMIGVLDSGLTEEQVKIPGKSFKGSLEKINVGIASSSNREQLKRINTIDNHTKLKEILYHVRFMFYQTFSDNAISIDYGVKGMETNSPVVILKAKIKNTVTFNPYVQILTDKGDVGSRTFNAGDIITITLSTNELNREWSAMSTDSVLPGFGAAFSFEQGEKSQVQQGMIQKTFSANMWTWDLNISNGNTSIKSFSSLVLRTFTFIYPYKDKN